MSDSLITKKAIAAGFKEIMKKKSLEKITIADITKQCGLNRQTFYYHFQDKYELVDWIYYNDVISTVLYDELTYDNWSDSIQRVLTIMKDESYFYENALNSDSSESFQNYIFAVIKEIFCSVMDRITEDKKIDEDDKKFISEFFTIGMVGVIVRWAKNGMRESPESITRHLRNLVYDSKLFAIKRFFEESNGYIKTNE